MTTNYRNKANKIRIKPCREPEAELTIKLIAQRPFHPVGYQFQPLHYQITYTLSVFLFKTVPNRFARARVLIISTACLSTAGHKLLAEVYY